MDKVLGVRIQELLSERGYSRKQFSELTGITEAALCRYINGQREPKAITLSVIANALNVSIDQLLGTPCSSIETLNDAVDLVARSSKEISPEQKEKLIRALVNY